MTQETNGNVVFTERPLDVHKAFIADFWKEFGLDGKKTFVSPKSKSATLEAMKRLGRVVLRYHGKSPAERREAFNAIKADRHKLSSHKHCFACRQITNTPARHHLIWLRNGGINSKRNMVTLCFECHADVHPWLRAEYRARRDSYVQQRNERGVSV
jgi:5-methylcytosine-specific restriction endonuclease McrA